VRVENHTLLLIRSVSRFFTKISVQWGIPLTDALLRTSEFVSAVTRARTKSHTTPNTECVTILFIISLQWGILLTDALLWTSEFVSAVDRVRRKSHTTPNTECVTILYQNISSVRYTPHRNAFWEPPSLSRQLLARVENHTLLLIHSVSRFSTKILVQWGKTLHRRTFGEPLSLSWQLLVRVENHTLLLIHSVSRFSTKISVQPHIRTFENLRVCLGSYSCA